jgi:anti-anti-sigma factor
MYVGEKIEGEVAVVTLHGNFVDENDEIALHQKITSLLVDGMKKIVLDLQSLHQINMIGLETLARTFAIARSKGGQIRIAEVDRQIENVFVKTRLVRIFDSYETVGRAMASFMV